MRGIQTIEPFLEITEVEWHRIMNVDLTGTFLISQLVVAEMLHNSGDIKGKILNMSSILQDTAGFNKIPYAVSKAGIQSLTKNMAPELAREKINVNAIDSGAIVTSMNAETLGSPAKLKALQYRIPWGRLGQVEEVANLAVLLVSSDADYITGEVISI